MKSKLENLYIQNENQTITYKPSKGGGGNENYPHRSNRKIHAKRLSEELNHAWDKYSANKETISAVSVSKDNGIYLEIKGKAGYDLITKSLEDLRQKVRICNIRTIYNDNDEEIVCTTVFVPEKKREFFVKKLQKFKETEKKEKVINTIEHINLAIVDSLWTSEITEKPEMISKWCEVWLMFENKENPNDIAREFFSVCEDIKIEYKENKKIIFPERIVLAIKADRNQLSILLWSYPKIAEFRIMKTPAGFFYDLSSSDQRDFVDDFADRIDLSLQSNTSVCIFDTGVNNGHKLLSPILSDVNMHSVDESRGYHDINNHGTRMAGIAGYFTIEDKLESSAPIVVNHFLESVKILDNSNDNNKELFGSITEEAVYLAEIKNSDTNRSICLAVTAPSNTIKNDGRPSSWSGAIDSIISGANQIEETDVKKRLMFVSAGNTGIEEIKEVKSAKTAVINHAIEDPAQAWNAITVGAYTNKFQLPEEVTHSYKPVAEPGSFSPFTSSSLMWSKKWPMKPDIVLEGGNLGYDESEDFYSSFPNLGLLTTSKDFSIGKSFDTINMTSSATAQAACMGANIYHHYPDLWPETIRALIIHSSDWTDAMKRSLFENAQPKRSDYRILMRTCGYGVPDLDRAIWSASNRVNLIVEDEIQPFKKNNDYRVTANEMHIHDIPWPSDVLLKLENENVKMRITLSYYIEPGPGEIGWKDKYRYPSCGLQFDLNNATEDRENFLKRINVFMREDDNDKSDVKNDSNRWIIGSSNRNIGSIHSDIWEGTASELSQCNHIAIYPITGWWKSRNYLKQFNSKIRYSLIVSIETPEVDVDLYSIIKNKIELETKIDNKVEIKNEIEY